MVSGVVTAFVRLIVTGYGSPFMRGVLDDRNVAIGMLLSPVCPGIVMTAEPGELTAYNVGDGEIDAMMWWLGSISSLDNVVTVTLADFLPAGIVSTGFALR